jgi:hypothetical protein
MLSFGRYLRVQVSMGNYPVYDPEAGTLGHIRVNQRYFRMDIAGIYQDERFAC